MTSWQWDGFSVGHYGCNGGWQLISRPGLEHHRIDSTFVSLCTTTNNDTYTSGEWDFVAPTNCLAAPTDGWAMFTDTNSWDYYGSFATTNTLMQPDRGLTFAVETNDVYCGDGEFYVSNRMTETGSLTFHAPFHYPPNKSMLLTFEGMTSTNVVLHFGSSDVSPFSADASSGDVSFMVNVTGGMLYPINASSFTWPSSSSSTTNGPDQYCGGDDGEHARTFNSFSFTGFHNAKPELWVTPTVGSTVGCPSITSGRYVDPWVDDAGSDVKPTSRTQTNMATSHIRMVRSAFDVVGNNICNSVQQWPTCGNVSAGNLKFTIRGLVAGTYKFSVEVEMYLTACGYTSVTANGKGPDDLTLVFHQDASKFSPDHSACKIVPFSTNFTVNVTVTNTEQTIITYDISSNVSSKKWGFGEAWTKITVSLVQP